MKKDLPTEERVQLGQILGRVIIEILGAPKEHIEKTLKEYVEKLKQDTDIQIIKEDFTKAAPQEKLFSAFVELEIWFTDISKLLEFCFDSMPSSIEILEPSDFHFKANDFAGLINDLQAKLHKFDMIIKNLNARVNLLDKNGQALIRNMLNLILKEKDEDLKTLTSKTGVEEKKLLAFIDELEKQGVISKVNDKYHLEQR